MENKRNILSESILIEQSKERGKLTKEDIVKHVVTTLRKSPRQLLDLLIKEIRMYDDKIEIDLHFVDKKSPDDDNRWGFCFYKCKKSGKYYTMEKDYLGNIEKTFELEILLYV